MKKQYQPRIIPARLRALLSLKSVPAILLASLCALGGSANAATLVHYYYSDTGTTITNDQVGTAHGTLYGASTVLQGGTGGSALRTTNAAAGLTAGVPGNGMLLPSSVVSGITNKFTIMNWFQTVTGGGGRQMWVFSDNTTGNMLAGLPSDYNGSSWYGHVYGRTGSSSFVDLFGTLHTSPNNWLDDNNLHQMILTCDGTTLTMYIDGALGGSTAVGSITNLSLMTTPVVSGGSPWGAGDQCINGRTLAFGIIDGSITAGNASALFALGTNATAAQVSSVIATFVSNSDVWDGGSALNDNWTSVTNWAGDVAPLASGRDIFMAGNTRKNPVVDSTYSINSLTFSNNITSSGFTLNSSGGSMLTNSGGIVNNSTTAQTLNVPLVMFGGSFNAASGGLTLNSNITLNAGVSVPGAANTIINGAFSGGGLSKSGSGTLTLNGVGTNTFIAVNGGTTLVKNSLLSSANGDATRIDSGGTLIVDGATMSINGGGMTPLGNTLSTTSALIITNNAVVNVTNNYGMNVGRNGSGILTIASGLFYHNAALWGFVMGDQADSANSTVNLNGGTMQINLLMANYLSGAAVFNFNGGTLAPTASRTDFWDSSAKMTANILAGGAIIDTTNFNVTIAQALTDGGVGGALIKKGAGVLTLSAALPGMSGPMILKQGGLVLNASGSPFLGSLSVSNAAELTVSLNGGTLFYSGGNIKFDGSNTLNLAYGSIVGTPPSAIQTFNTLTPGTTTKINISGSGLTLGLYPLITFTTGSATTNGFILGTLPPGVFGKLTNSTATSLDLLVTGAGDQLSWRGSTDGGATASTNWTLNTGNNWYNIATLSADIFTNLDNAIFDDDAYFTTVQLNTTVNPSTVVVSNETKAYSIAGSGAIGGSTALNKIGASSLALLTANTYSGGTAITGGTLAVTNDNALGTAGVTLGGGALQLDGPVTSSRSVTMTANSSIGVGSAFSATLKGAITGNGTLTKTGNGTLTMTNYIGTSGSFTVAAGTAVFDGTISPSTDISVGTDLGTGAVNQVSGTATTGGGNWLRVGTGAAGTVGAYNLTGSGAFSADRIIIGQGTGANPAVGGGGVGTMTVNNGSVTDLGWVGGWWERGAITVGQNDGGVGTFNLVNGTVTSPGACWIGSWGGNGTWNQTGGTATFSTDFWVGMYQDNDATQPNGSFGTALVQNGTLNVGNLGVGFGINANSKIDGVMTIGSGGIVNSEGDVQVGFAGDGALWGSQGTLTIQNGGTLNVGSSNYRWLSVGRYDTCNGTLNVNAGGTVNLYAGSDLIIHQYGTGVATVNVSGSILGTGPADGDATLVNLSVTNATLNINSGGLVQAKAIYGDAGGAQVNINGGTVKAVENDPGFISLYGEGASVNILAGGATINTAGFDVTVPSVLHGSGALTKTGLGALTLNATNAYTGLTTVSAGTLGGFGTVTGAVTVASAAGLAPANVGGALTIKGAISLNATSTNVFNVYDGGTNDAVVVGSTVTYGGVLKIVPTGTFTVGQQFQLFSGTGATNTGNFASVQSTDSGVKFSFTNGVLTVIPSINPNPPVLQVSRSGSTMTLGWPTNLGWILQSNGVSLKDSASWITIPGSTTVTQQVITIAPGNTNVFFRMLKP